MGSEESTRDEVGCWDDYVEPQSWIMNTGARRTTKVAEIFKEMQESRFYGHATRREDGKRATVMILTWKGRKGRLKLRWMGSIEHNFGERTIGRKGTRRVAWRRLVRTIDHT